jgi:hypothetical protein
MERDRQEAGFRSAAITLALRYCHIDLRRRELPGALVRFDALAMVALGSSYRKHRRFPTGLRRH